MNKKINKIKKIEKIKNELLNRKFKIIDYKGDEVDYDNLFIMLNFNNIDAIGTIYKKSSSKEEKLILIKALSILNSLLIDIIFNREISNIKNSATIKLKDKELNKEMKKSSYFILTINKYSEEEQKTFIANDYFYLNFKKKNSILAFLQSSIKLTQELLNDYLKTNPKPKKIKKTFSQNRKNPVYLN